LPEWLIEDGIGETRAALIENGEIVEARVRRDGVTPAGTILDARLVAVAPRVAVEAGGEQFLMPRGVSGISEGSRLRIEVVREALGGTENWKRGLARRTEEEPRPAPPLAEGTPGHVDGWDEVLDEARSGIVSFDGGELRIEPTAAMTMIDVDGWLVPDKLAQMGAWAAARAIRRLDIGGPTGIDFPTLKGREARQQVDSVLAEYLPAPAERTAMNGFGFVQLVARLERPSLLHRATFQRTAMAARKLLRRAELLDGAGAILLSGHPALEAQLRPEWLAELARRTGREVRWEARPGLAIEAPQAQLVPR